LLDLADVVTVPEAAERLECSQAMVRNWIVRHHIARVNPDSGTRPHYRLIDIARAEQKARQYVALKRTRASA
jgi:hypothetical protein